MKESKSTSPPDRTDLIDLYFLENRIKLNDIAAFLDRLDRADDASKPEDFRIQAFNKAIGIISDPGPGKARRVLEVFSDHSVDLADSTPQSKGAVGASQESID